MEEQKKRDRSIPRGITCLLNYLIPFFGGLFFLIVEKEDRLVRFHAVQSILFWIFFAIYGVVINAVIRIGFIRGILQLAFLAAWVFIMYQAVMERMYELPLIGEIVKQQAFGTRQKRGEGEPPAGDSNTGTDQEVKDREEPGEDQESSKKK